MNASFPTFDDVVRSAGRLYDPPERLLRTPTVPNIHTEHFDTSERHPIRESLYYALALLAAGGVENGERAAAVIDRVLDLQECGDPDDRLYGLWHYVAEETVQAWPLPDLNWADFNGMSLLLILHAAGQRLEATLRARIAEGLRRAAICIRRRDVDLHYTNIAIKGTLVTFGVAELLGDGDLLAYARDRMERLHGLLLGSEGVAEYNSPTYAGVCLSVLMAFPAVVRDERARTLAREIEGRFWLHLARHFHRPTGELAGPHSRGYHLTLREAPGTLGHLLESVCGGRLGYDAAAAVRENPFGPLYALLLRPALPEAARALLLDAAREEEVRETTQRFSQGSAAAITTWIEPAFCLGTVNFQDGWEQRHNLIAYWVGPQATGFLHQMYLHDERPCCSGFFAADQRDGRVLAGNFLGNYADHHVSFRVPGIRASFLGPVLELESGGGVCEVFVDGRPVPAHEEVDWSEGESLAIRLSAVWLHLKLLRNRAPLGGERPGRVRHDGTHLRVAVAHYRGPARDLTWAEAGPAHTCYSLTMSAPQADWPAWRRDCAATPDAQRETEEKIHVTWSGLHLALPRTVPTPEEVRVFYR